MKQRERWEKLFIPIGNARLGLVIVALVFVWQASWWVLLPIAGFAGLVVWHEQVARRRQLAVRRIAFYERGVARLDGGWPETGSHGERFRDGEHVYAEDLDLFGRGSLFQLLSLARTGSGEATLASWLKAPAQRAEAADRQDAIRELRGKLDLREDIAVLGYDIAAGVHERELSVWGHSIGAPFVRFARPIAIVLTAAAIGTFAFAMVGVGRWALFLVTLLIEFGFIYLMRHGVGHVMAGVDTPARDLHILALITARLEQESFTSPRLAALRARLDLDGEPASKRIAQLQRWIELLHSSHNQLVAVIAPVVLWREHVTMAIEDWRVKWGPSIGTWLDAVGELEALGSLAAFHYERPDAHFPELMDSTSPVLEAVAVKHALLAAGKAVANDVALNENSQLWIVSGSNMSGKSTLMRAVGLGAVLAWTGAPVPAERFRISRLSVGASLRTVDSVQDGRSRFYAEIRRLSQIVNAARQGPTLFLLDELLSGTNSHDRRIGAEALVRGLVAKGAIGFVTTHDLALASLADSIPGSRNVHFEDQIEGGEIHFDYKLRDGVVTRSNALALMRAVGLEV
ncbi:MAG: DNA mismatch repair protein MutS [Bryobacteraceae bacterium]